MLKMFQEKYSIFIFCGLFISVALSNINLDKKIRIKKSVLERQTLLTARYNRGRIIPIVDKKKASTYLK